MRTAFVAGLLALTLGTPLRAQVSSPPPGATTLTATVVSSKTNQLVIRQDSGIEQTLVVDETSSVPTGLATGTRVTVRYNTSEGQQRLISVDPIGPSGGSSESSAPAGSTIAAPASPEPPSPEPPSPEPANPTPEITAPARRTLADRTPAYRAPAYPTPANAGLANTAPASPRNAPTGPPAAPRGGDGERLPKKTASDLPLYALAGLALITLALLLRTLLRGGG